MYKVFYNGCKAKQFGNRTFRSYDAARNAVRVHLRNWYGPFDHNPVISAFNYSIKKA